MQTATITPPIAAAISQFPAHTRKRCPRDRRTPKARPARSLERIVVDRPVPVPPDLCDELVGRGRQQVELDVDRRLADLRALVETGRELHASRLVREHSLLVTRHDPEPSVCCTGGQDLLPRDKALDLIPSNVDPLHRITDAVRIDHESRCAVEQARRPIPPEEDAGDRERPHDSEPDLPRGAVLGRKDKTEQAECRGQNGVRKAFQR